MATRVRKVLGYACDGDDRIECHDVTGEALGVVTMSLTIVGRDQWWCRQLAQDILNHVTWSLRNEAGATLDLQSWRLEPHQNRGYAHGRTKPYREPRPHRDDSRSPGGTESSPDSADLRPETEAPHD